MPLPGPPAALNGKACLPWLLLFKSTSLERLPASLAPPVNQGFPLLFLSRMLGTSVMPVIRVPAGPVLPCKTGSALETGLPGWEEVPTLLVRPAPPCLEGGDKASLLPVEPMEGTVRGVLALPAG